MTDVPTLVRSACARVATRARYVTIELDAIPAYAASLSLSVPALLAGPAPNPEGHVLGGSADQRAAFWLTLDAINFGSGWFPTLRKREGRSGYSTVAAGVRE